MQIGAFQNKLNALQCKNQYARKISDPIQINAPKNDHGMYAVVVGPYTDPLALKAVSQQLRGEATHLAEQPSSLKKTQAIVKSVILPHTLAQNHTLTPKLSIPTPSPKHATVETVSADAALLSKKTPKAEGKAVTELQAAADLKPHADKPSLLDNQTIEDNQMSKTMLTSRKMHFKSDRDRESIENKTLQLQSERAVIELKLQKETNKKELAALEKRKNSIDREIDGIMNAVIQRISRK